MTNGLIKDGKFILSDENLEKSILKSLFMDINSKKSLNKAKIYFDNNGLTLNKILTDFKKLTNKKEEQFWSKFLDILNATYNDVNKEDMIKLLKKDFPTFIDNVLKIRFDHLFTPDFTQDFNSDKENKNWEEEIKKDHIVLKDGNELKILWYEKWEERGNTEPYTPGQHLYYPITLVKINGDKKTIEYTGSKTNKSRIENKLKQISESPELISDKTYPSEKFTLDIRCFLNNLKKNNMFIRKLIYLSPKLFICVKSNDILNIENTIDSNYFLKDYLDFINLKEIELVYYKEINKRLVEFPFRLRITKELKNRYFKINYTPLSRKKDCEYISDEIKKIIKSMSLECGKCYALPLDYYFEELFKSNKEYSKKNGFKNIIERDPDNITIKKLIAKNILNSDPFMFDEDKFITYLSNEIRKYKEKRIDVNGNFFEILNVKKVNNFMEIDCKWYSDKNNFNKFHRIVLPLRGNPVRGYNKILNPILTNLNYYEILSNDNNPEKCVTYFYSHISHYLRTQYSIILEKEVNFAKFILQDYLKNMKLYEPKKEGYRVEKAINVILKYIYRNFIPLGGANRPDGYLITQKENCYILDSKQHKEINQQEVGKVLRYMKKYTKKDNLPDVKGGFMVVSLTKLKTNSLNAKAQDYWVDDKDIYLSFVTVEFIIEYLDFYQININKICSSSDLIKQFLEILDVIINKSVRANEADKIREFEKKKLKEFQQKLNRHNYYPHERNEE
ncbi:MAG: hypothetical protein KJ771_08695 [Nanoarchaeota archaeon]|nr:hypothetical protein [Nanoarchaeota archaeon]